MSIKTDWGAVSVPKAQIALVKEFVEDAPEYSSIADFVKKAIAEKLQVARVKNVQLTDDEVHLLLAAAEDYGRVYEHFDEDGVRSFLKQRYASERAKWPDWKIELAMMFICSQPWKKWN